ncbi:MAG: hypothetical protein RLZZ24_801 [Pseudomonadota bacterium]|jgi:hypothetical protein
MDALDLALHGLNFVAPAWFLAVGLVVLGRFWPRAALGRVTWPWAWQVLLLGCMGTAVLVAGLWWFGVDGKMATYAALVLGLALVQSLIARVWRP